MSKKLLINYLLSNSVDSDFISDIYFNNVELFLPFDYTFNSKGKPLYSDFSSKQRQVRKYIGSSLDSDIQFIDSNNIKYPNINTINGINVNNFLYFPNNLNYNQRLAEYNTGVLLSELKSTYLHIPLNGANPISFGTEDFTIEFSFFTDSVTLPWTYQTIFNYGLTLVHWQYLVNLTPSSLKNQFTRNSSYFNGFGIFLKDNKLVFSDIASEKILYSDIQPLNWYHVAIQRKNSVLECYINFNKVYTLDNYTLNFNFNLNTNENSVKKSYSIGSCHVWSQITNIVTYYDLNELYNQIEQSFSGGLSNLRITKEVARIKQDIYSAKLPFYFSYTDNKLDSLYNDVIVNYPFSYDLFDYSEYRKHFTNKSLLATSPDFKTNFLYLDGETSYTSEQIPTNLNPLEWTIEFYYTYFLTSEPYVAGNGNFSGKNNLPELSPHDILSYLVYNGSNAINPKIDENINIVSITSNNKKVLDLNLRWLFERFYFGIGSYIPFESGNYLYLKISSNGNDWINVDSERYWIDDGYENSYGYKAKIYPTDLVLFKHTDGYNNNIKIKSGYQDPCTHFAVQIYQGNLYLLVNGNVVNIVPFNYSLYSELNATEVSISKYPFQTITLNKDNRIEKLSIGIKGLRITNKARYSTVNLNEFNAYHNTHNVSLTSGVLAPPRARILGILKTVDLPSISTATAKWRVFLSQQLDNLIIDDFTLTQLEGVTDAELISLVKITELEYEVTANTGEGSGKLGLNFIDRKTVKYKDTNTFISYYPGELSFEGEQYNVNKANPIPSITSGSNPYIKDAFTVDVIFDSAIEIFYPEKVGVVNGTITKNERIRDDINAYRLTIQPTLQDPVIIQALEGAGVTDTNKLSEVSNSLTRVYAESFPILQMPLDIPNGYTDLSPSRLQFTDATPGNTLYATEIAPLGALSSLHVKPNLEQSSVYKLDFNSVASTNTITDLDWTIEFFLRIDSSNSKTSHIFSIENEGKGLAFYSSNTNIRVVRSMNNITDVFSNLIWKDRDTAYYDWNDNTKTPQQKFPHFAITKEGEVFRFYINGVRTQLKVSSAQIDITKGNIYIGYYSPRIDDTEFYLSNLKITLGKAVYRSAFVNIPGLPYTIIPNISDITELLSYISIYSNNNNANRATLDNKIIIKFISIIDLITTPIVTINGVTADLVKGEYNTYNATTTVDNTFEDGLVNFIIDIVDEPGIGTKSFSNTTNSSFVLVDLNPLTATFTTNEPNDSNNYVIDAYIEFNKDLESDFNIGLLTTTNCICSAIYKLSNTKYQISIKAVTSGEFSVRLEANKIKDLAGNFNTESNTLTRIATLPNYIPDIYWNNVIFLIDSDISITDESLFSTEILNSNCVLDSSQSPVGLSKSIRFNGNNSYLRFKPVSPLTKSSPYTVEFFVYISKSTVIKLDSPNLYPANNVTNNSFNLTWTNVTDASNYKVDVSLLQSFDSYVDIYKNYLTDNVNLTVGNKNNITIPSLANSKFISSNGVALKINKDLFSDILGYRYDVALDSLFNNQLYLHKNKYTINKTLDIGELENPYYEKQSSVHSEYGTWTITYTDSQTNVVSNYSWKGYSDDAPVLALYPSIGCLDNMKQSLINNKTGEVIYDIFKCSSRAINYTFNFEADLITETDSLNTGNLITGLMAQTNGVKLLYILDESSIRLYKEQGYEYPGMVEDVDIHRWTHIAITNDTKHTYLYRDGKLEDKIKAVDWQDDYIQLGYYLGYIDGYMQGIRITYGVNRYPNEFNVPLLPYAKN